MIRVSYQSARFIFVVTVHRWRNAQPSNQNTRHQRQQYGGYKAGTDGTGYTLSQTYAPPGSEYVSQYQDQIDQWTDKVTNQNPRLRSHVGIWLHKTGV